MLNNALSAIITQNGNNKLKYSVNKYDSFWYISIMKLLKKISSPVMKQNPIAVNKSSKPKKP
jgi:hypothetical protein